MAGRKALTLAHGAWYLSRQARACVDHATQPSSQRLVLAHRHRDLTLYMANYLGNLLSTKIYLNNWDRQQRAKEEQVFRVLLFAIYRFLPSLFLAKPAPKQYYLHMGTNKKYKASVFSFLFSDPDILRELYCALEGVSLPPDTPVTINTLQDVLYMDRMNDISFEIGGKLVVLVEHQSTINPNMALRLLIYIARVYEKIIDNKTIYGTKQVTIPRPEFFVLYNGTAPYPDEKIIKLSEMFEDAASLGLPCKMPALELEVKVLNINQGRNEGIVKNSRTLASYSAFVGKVQEYVKSGKDRQEAMRAAVQYCHEHDILKEFLEKNATEVMNMLITEWSWDDAKEVWQNEARAEGREEGREEERDYFFELLDQGLSTEEIKQRLRKEKVTP